MKENLNTELRSQTNDIAHTLNCSDKPTVVDGKELEKVANRIFNKYSGAFEKLAE